MKKRDITKLYEILDSDGNLIGSDDQPANNPNEISADGTTDHNAAIGHQHFAHDFLGRFGFYMYNEGEGDSTSSTDELIDAIARETYTYFEGDNDNFTPFENLTPQQKQIYIGFASNIIGVLNRTSKPKEPTLSESEMAKMIEDVITTRKDKSLINKSDKGFLDASEKNKLKSLLNSLSDKDKGELIKHLKTND